MYLIWFCLAYIVNQTLVVVLNFIKYCSHDLRKAFQKVTGNIMKQENNENANSKKVIGFSQGQRRVSVSDEVFAKNTG